MSARNFGISTSKENHSESVRICIVVGNCIYEGGIVGDSLGS